MNCPECSKQFTCSSNSKDLAQIKLEEELKAHYREKHGATEQNPPPPPLLLIIETNPLNY